MLICIVALGLAVPLAMISLLQSPQFSVTSSKQRNAVKYPSRPNLHATTGIGYAHYNCNLYHNCKPASQDANQTLQACRPSNQNSKSMYSTGSRATRTRLKKIKGQHSYSDNPSQSSIRTLMAQRRAESAVWTSEKAQMRRELQQIKKQLHQLSQENVKYKALCEHRNMDMQALKAALRGRDEQIDGLQSNNRRLREQLNSIHDKAAESMAQTTGERDDLRYTLAVAQERLQCVDQLLSDFQNSQSTLLELLQQLQSDRAQAIQAAEEAQGEVNKLRIQLHQQDKVKQIMQEVHHVSNAHTKEIEDTVKNLIRYRKQNQQQCAETESEIDASQQQVLGDLTNQN